MRTERLAACLGASKLRTVGRSVSEAGRAEGKEAPEWHFFGTGGATVGSGRMSYLLRDSLIRSRHAAFVCDFIIVAAEAAACIAGAVITARLQLPEHAHRAAADPAAIRVFSLAANFPELRVGFVCIEDM